jgi:hypothetical protein
MRQPSIEVVLWLFTAAASGVVGNLTYDVLKELVAGARTQNWDFALTLRDWLLARTSGEGRRRRVDTRGAPVEPDDHLSLDPPTGFQADGTPEIESAL